MFWEKKNNINNNDNFGNADLSIVNYLTDGLFVFGKENKLLIINPQGKKIFDVEENQVLGKSVLDLGRFEKLNVLISFLGAGLRECFREQIEIEGNLVIEVTSVHMKSRQERVSTLIIVHDITREKLSDKMKSEFVTLAAHQLRTPISGVKWSLQTLLDGDFGDLNEGQKRVVEEAFKTNNKVINLINDLLNVAEIEEGRYLNKVVLYDVSEVILSVIEDYKTEAEKKKVKINFTPPKEALPKVMLDVEKIKIVVSNLVDNAVRYNLEGGEINISVKNYEKEIEVKIEDTGLGVPMKEQEKMFTKFFRSSNIRKVDTEGTGLGLYIVKNIIEAHEGKIWFDSEENRGTAFYFTLPVKKNFGEFLTSDFY
jgi:signal transduction histidine kinase